ncbi:hypothetical protein EZS27_032243 [termite gut metagenome]|uniref:DUF4062 domain-containing protein n=1 Tax=termite gut metagenome TaxID=433724 RepID=A0A5J4Q9D5_9ZZZZ
MSQVLNAQLELIKWETHTYPSIGKYPQDVINSQINNNYDIFIGILWNKFGSPTLDYSSGTEEEFYNTFNMYQKDPSKVKIMMYFNNEALPLNSIDIEQLSKVRAFKTTISNKGCLYWEYNTSTQFEELIKTHLVQVIRNWQNTNSEHEPTLFLSVTQTNADDSVDVGNKEDFGLFEFQDIIETKLEEVRYFMEEFAKHTMWIGGEIQERTGELNDIHASSSPFTNQNVRIVVSKTAKGLIQYANKITPIIENWLIPYKDGMKAMDGLLNISDDFINSDNLNDLYLSKSAIISMYETISECEKQINAYYKSLKDMPRMSQQLIIAQKNVLNKLKLFLKDMECTKIISLNLIKTINNQ